MPQRERYLFVCTNRRPDGNPKGSCAQGGSEAIREALKSECDQRGLRNVVRVCTSGCLDLCWAGPSIAVMPDNVFYGHVTREDVPEIIESFAARSIVTRLVLPPEEFDSPEKREKRERSPQRSEAGASPAGGARDGEIPRRKAEVSS